MGAHLSAPMTNTMAAITAVILAITTYTRAASVANPWITSVAAEPDWDGAPNAEWRTMTLFRSNNQRDLWQDRWCHSCFQPDEAARRIQGKEGVECPIWAKAMREDRKPPQWDRNTRTDEVWRMIKCNSYTSQPAVQKRKGEQQFEDVPLFEVTPYAIDIGFVPVEGWPDRPKKDGVDHQ